MPTPRTAQDANSPSAPLKRRAPINPPARTTFERANPPRPPLRSIAAPPPGRHMPRSTRRTRTRQNPGARHTDARADRVGEDRRKIVARRPGERLRCPQRRDDASARSGLPQGLVLISHVVRRCRSRGSSQFFPTLVVFAITPSLPWAKTDDVCTTTSGYPARWN